MSSQLVPINQLDALPILTIAGVVNGTLYTVGGRVARYFSPDDLQLNGVTFLPFAFGGANPCWYLVTPYLNLSGCTVISLLLAKTYVGGTAQGGAVTAFRQERETAADAPDPFYITTPGTVSDALAGKVPLAAASAFLAANAAGDVQRQLITWGGTVLNSFGQQNAFGANSRIVISTTAATAANVWQTSATPTVATLTASMWAS